MNYKKPYRLPNQCLLIRINPSVFTTYVQTIDTYHFLETHVLIVAYTTKKFKDSDSSYVDVGSFKFIPEHLISHFDYAIQNNNVTFMHWEKEDLIDNPYFTLRTEETTHSTNWILEVNPSHPTLPCHDTFLILTKNEFSNEPHIKIPDSIAIGHELDIQHTKLNNMIEITSELSHAFNQNPSLQTKEVEAFIDLFNQRKKKLDDEFKKLCHSPFRK